MRASRNAVTTPNPALTGTPAGTVTFYDNGAVIAGSLTTLSSAGMANYPANLSVGAHRLTAVFTIGMMPADRIAITVIVMTNSMSVQPRKE